MVATEVSFTSRRAVLAGLAASSALALPACSTLGSLSLVDAIRRLLTRASGNALARLAAPGGFQFQFRGHQFRGHYTNFGDTILNDLPADAGRIMLRG